MAWSGAFVFGDAWAAYRGPVSDNTPHQHVAVQVAIAADCDSEVTLRFGQNQSLSARGVVISPRLVHALSSAGPSALLYAEPQSPIGRTLTDLLGAHDVAVLPDSALYAVDVTQAPENWLEGLGAGLPASRRAINARLECALAHLARAPGDASVRDAVAASGLSASRLRALAHAQLGFSLATWLLWRKLERASRALAAGASLRDAAQQGGFSDQAHLARTMRRMFGVTPGEASGTLR